MRTESERRGAREYKRRARKRYPEKFKAAWARRRARRIASSAAYAHYLYELILKRLASCASYKGRRIAFSRPEFLAWCAANTQYQELFQAWKDSGDIPALSPTVDRINNDGDYTFDNIEMVARHINSKRFWEWKRQKGFKSKSPLRQQEYAERKVKREALSKELGRYISAKDANELRKQGYDL